MDVKRSSVAYDLSLFEEKKKISQPKKDNVIVLPKGKLEKNARRKINPLAMITTGLIFSMSVGVVGTMIYNQVQLTELTESINVTNKKLNEAESVYTQLQVNMESKLSLDTVEKYAKEELGMNKSLPGSVQYISLAAGDKSEVSKDGKNNIFNKLFKIF